MRNETHDGKAKRVRLGIRYDVRGEREVHVMNTKLWNVGVRKTGTGRWIGEFAHNEDKARPLLDGCEGRVL